MGSNRIHTSLWVTTFLCKFRHFLPTSKWVGLGQLEHLSLKGKAIRPWERTKAWRSEQRPGWQYLERGGETLRYHFHLQLWQAVNDCTHTGHTWAESQRKRLKAEVLSRKKYDHWWLTRQGLTKTESPVFLRSVAKALLSSPPGHSMSSTSSPWLEAKVLPHSSCQPQCSSSGSGSPPLHCLLLSPTAPTKGKRHHLLAASPTFPATWHKSLSA